MAPQRPSAARIEAGHELAASGAGGGQVLVSLGEAAAELMVLLGKVGHLLLELADVIGLSEAGLAPDLDQRARALAGATAGQARSEWRQPQIAGA